MQEGSMFTALSGALSLKRRLDTVSNNLANVNTTGFKADRLNFDGVLSQAGQRPGGGPDDGVMFPVIREDYTDQAQGNLKQTGRDLDFAIKGDGFFRVQTAEGEAYTRDGRFHLNNEGQLVDVDGRSVLNAEGEPVTLPSREVTANGDGELFVPGRETPVARLGLVQAQEPQQLQKRGDNLYTSAEPNMQPADGVRIRNGYLEGSNVNTMEEMVKMMDLQRSFQSATKAMRTIDEAYSKNAQDLASAGR
ncbi:MAG TPA: flagellar basal-body rod protein FlgF [Gammaproteobacteria bacterium]|nr:flagellar basal-body rod protein FlgF [Gammaproteobacteria bacterium]